MTKRGDYKSAVMDLIHSVAGQANVLTIPRVLIDFMGSVEGGLLLSQIIYWQGRSSHGGGWFYKTYSEWEEELCLSKYKVGKLSAQMKDKGFLATQVKKANGNPTVHYLFNCEEFERQLVNYLQKRPVPEKESKKFNFGKSKNFTNDSEKTSRSLTETTAETTNRGPALKDAQGKETTSDANASGASPQMPKTPENSQETPEEPEPSPEKAERIKQAITGLAGNMTKPPAARKKRPSKADPRTSRAEIERYRAVTGRFPPKPRYDSVIDALHWCNDAQAAAIYDRWKKSGYNPANPDWVEWAQAAYAPPVQGGRGDGNGNGNGSKHGLKRGHVRRNEREESYDNFDR